MRKRTIDEIRKREFLKMSELAELNGVRYSTVKYYSELGLLPYRQYGKRLAKYYPSKEASQRLKEILRLRKKGRSISEIVNWLIKNGFNITLTPKIIGEVIRALRSQKRAEDELKVVEAYTTQNTQNAKKRAYK